MGKRRLPVAAERFDLAVDDPRHRELRDTAWIGGPYTEGMYFLGKFLGTNEFCNSFEAYESHLKQCVRNHLPKSTWLLQSPYLHEFMIVWLKDVYRRTGDHRRFPFRAATKEDLAIVLVLENGDLSDVAIRERIGCTEKSMRRWSSFGLLRRELKRLA